jgi:hypothetical protein
MVMTHDPTCSGCPECSEEMLRVLSMTPKEHAEWLRKRRPARRKVLRMTARPPGTAEPPREMDFGYKKPNIPIPGTGKSGAPLPPTFDDVTKQIKEKRNGSD